jgi:hypothetical protein
LGRRGVARRPSRRVGRRCGLRDRRGREVQQQPKLQNWSRVRQQFPRSIHTQGADVQQPA